MLHSLYYIITMISDANKNEKLKILSNVMNLLAIIYKKRQILKKVNFITEVLFIQFCFFAVAYKIQEGSINDKNGN